MTEQRTIKVTAYRTPDGKPTCATDFDAGEVCKFLATRKMGLIDVCALCCSDIQRDNDGRGYLVPADGCPVWAEVQSCMEAQK